MIREDFWSLDCKTVRIFASTVLQFIWTILFIERFSQWLRSLVLYSSFGVQTSVFNQNYVDFGSLFLGIIIRFVHVWSFL